MKYRGEMKLKNGEKIIASCNYCSKVNRQAIITKWQMDYAEFVLYDLQIYPYPYEEIEKEIIVKRRKEPKEANPTPMIRPAAVYDNNKSLYNYDY